MRQECKNLDIGGDARNAGHNLMVVCSRWNPESSVHNARNAHFMLGRLLGKDQSNASAILRRRAIGRVVHLKTQTGSFGNPLGVAFRINQSAVSGDIDSPIARSFVRCVITRSIRFIGCLNEYQNVVNHAWIAWPNFDRLYPCVFRQMGIHDHILIRHRTGRFDFHWLSKLEYRVRLANQPTIGKATRYW